jgi:hypothetical protein
MTYPRDTLCDGCGKMVPAHTTTERVGGLSVEIFCRDCVRDATYGEGPDQEDDDEGT